MDPAIIDLLVALGADPMARNASNDSTPLHVGAHRGSVEIIRRLLERGADVTATTKSGWLPIHNAILSIGERLCSTCCHSMTMCCPVYLQQVPTI
jgi:ankyrin repeat protein